MALRTHFSLLLCGLFIASCSESPCLKSNGKNKQETRWVDHYHSLTLKDGILYRLTADSTNKIHLEGGENLLAYIKTEVRAGDLSIENTNTCNFLRNNRKSITVTIPAAHVQYINYRGFGNLKTTELLTNKTLEIQVRESGDLEIGINTNQLTLIHAGFGDISLKGEANKFKIEYREFCKVSASSFIVDSLDVKSESFSEGVFHAHLYARMLLLGSGNVRLIGQAKTTIERLGTGNLIQ